MVVGAIVASDDGGDVDGISVTVTALNELIGEIGCQSCSRPFFSVKYRAGQKSGPRLRESRLLASSGRGRRVHAT